MISRALAAAGAIAAIALAGASAQAMDLVEQKPQVNEIMQGSGLAFALRFDQPIDHQHSSLTLVTPRGSKVLRARLDAERRAVGAGRVHAALESAREGWADADGQDPLQGCLLMAGAGTQSITRTGARNR
jgi:methionine-rich copper-binding protein CopC